MVIILVKWDSVSILKLIYYFKNAGLRSRILKIYLLDYLVNTFLDRVSIAETGYPIKVMDRQTF